MASYQQIVDDGKLKAAHSGLVTYTKKLTDGRSAAAYENIVIVSDTDDLVLDIKGTAINEYKYSDYDKKYVIVDGENMMSLSLNIHQRFGTFKDKQPISGCVRGKQGKAVSYGRTDVSGIF